MKKILISLSLLVIFTTSCKNHKQTDTMFPGDKEFQKISQDFLKGYLLWRPQFGVYLGFHEYDGKITDFTKSSINNELARLKLYDVKIQDIDSTSLSPNMYYDLRILQSGIKNEIFRIEDLESFSKNPMTYAGAVDVNIYISRDFAPIEDRIQSIIKIENNVPGIFSAAKANLVDSIPLPYIQVAIQIAKGSAEFLENDLTIALKEVKNDSLMSAFQEANKKAIHEINSYKQYLEKEKLPKAQNNFAIGKEKYQKMLLMEGIHLSPEKILEIGLSELIREQGVFNRTAKLINPDKTPIDVFHDMQKEHPSADSLISQTRKDLETIRQFLLDRNIITLPSDIRAIVKETPQYARSISTASMDTPGPFETKAAEAYYYVTPVDPAWTSKQKEEWLSMFDYYTTDNVSIHEAYPGHYTQFLHLNASSATDIEKIFGSYAFIEGWAHYCEEMMIEEGFGQKDDLVSAAKARLAQSADALLRLCRLCVSLKMHCEGMTLDEATQFFMDNWYQGEKPSRQEALRGTFDPGYLFYSLGKLEILKLREDYKQQEGINFSLHQFHDRMLDHGMPPIRLLREVFLKDKSKWDEIL